MSDDKRLEQSLQGGAETPDGSERRGDAASRARNRTVMLTPEMTGKFRAKLTREETDEQPRNPLNDLLPDLGWGSPESEESAPRAETPFAAPAQRAAEEFVPVGRSPRESKEDAFGGFSRGERGLPQRDKTPTGKFSRAELTEGRGLLEAAAAPSAGAGLTAGMRATRAAGSEEIPMPMAAPKPAPVQELPKSKIIGFLVTFDKSEFGEVYEIRAGRWLISSRHTDYGQYILIPDDTISPLHAIIRATADGKIQILDQLSEHGTALKRVGEEEETELSGAMTTAAHADEIRFGQRRFVVCLVP